MDWTQALAELFVRSDSVDLEGVAKIAAGLLPFMDFSIRRAVRCWAVLAILGGLSACGGTASAPGWVIGGPGSIEGRFASPRGVSVGPKGEIYVVDRSGRIQRFSPEGRFERMWRTPSIEKGRPTCVWADPDGSVWVADTHYSRILCYTRDGDLVFSFGKEGTGPGEFLYPLALARLPDGNLVVTEYGGNDRVQVFTPEGKVVRAWGRMGTAPGEFQRPEGVCVSGGRIYVADSVNHRIQVFDLQGGLLAVWGRPGSGAGEFSYPYGVAAMDDGTIAVVEYGNHRVQWFRPDGECLGRVGSFGGGPAELSSPWGIAARQDELIVADTNNHRLVVWSLSQVTSDPGVRLSPRGIP